MYLPRSVKPIFIFSLVFLFGFDLTFSSFVKAETEEERVLKLIELATDKGEIAKLYNELSVDVQYQDAQKAIKYAQLSIDLALEIGNREQFFTSTANLATANCYAGNYVEAKQIAIEALTQAELERSISGRILMLENLGRCAKTINDYESALTYYNQALELTLSDENTDKSLLIQVYGNMAGLYVLLEQIDIAIDYYLKVKSLSNDGHTDRVAFVNLAYSYLKIGDLVKGEKYANDLLVSSQEVDSKQFEAYAYNMLGELKAAEFENLNQQTFLLESESYFALALKTMAEMDKNSLYSVTALNHGKALFHLGQYLESLDITKEALRVSEKLQIKETIVQSHFYVAENYLKLNNIQKASFHIEKFKTLNDEFYNENLSEKVSSMLVQFDTKNKEQELLNAKLQNESLKKDAKISFYLILIICVVAGSIISVLYILNNSRKKQTQIFEKLSRTDSLTGLKNRRAIEEVIEKEIVRFKRSGIDFCIAIADIDNFKQINDHYGHNCGDSVLEDLSSVLKNAIRENDELARWGG